MLSDDAVDVGDVVLQSRGDLVDRLVEPRIDRTRGADDDDLVVFHRVERPSERVRGLELARSGHEPVEAVEVGRERDEFGFEGGDEELHPPIVSGSPRAAAADRAPAVADRDSSEHGAAGTAHAW